MIYLLWTVILVNIDVMYQLECTICMMLQCFMRRKCGYVHSEDEKGGSCNVCLDRISLLPFRRAASIVSGLTVLSNEIACISVYIIEIQWVLIVALFCC